MTEYENGDQVRVTLKVGRWAGMEGTVIQVAPCPFSGGEPLVTVEMDSGGHIIAFEQDEVEAAFDPAPAVPYEPVIGEEIPFEYIKKGDRIRTVREFEDGFTLTMEGVAERLVPGANGERAWRQNGTHCAAPSHKGIAVKQHHILVDRKEPEDHLVLCMNPDGSYRISIGSDKPVTKTKAEELSKDYNNSSGSVCRYWAVKVPA